MGKQINFYMENEMQAMFLEHCFNQGFNILAEDLKNKKLVTYTELQEVNSDIYILYLYKKVLGEIIIDDNCEYRLDYLRSPVIEFTRNIIKPQEKKITRGRLWVETKYYIENNEMVSKDQQLTKEYNSLIRWLKKYVKFQEVTNGEFVFKEYVTDGIRDLTNIGFRLM